jgi:DNA-binding transcriptional MerR regulator
VSKGPDAFRTISEVASELNLPQHVLRFWETRFAQIKPLKRGGGRRYYRPDDVELLRGIRHLLYGEGYTIRGVQRILKEQGARFVTAAGRGEVAVPPSPGGAEIDDHEEPDDHGFNGGGSEIPDVVDRAPPAGRMVPPQPQPSPRPPLHGGSGGVAAGGSTQQLSQDEKERLQTTLSELLELKRLLDQTR